MQDWIDIDFGIAEGVDFIAISFVKTSEVIKHLKSYIQARSPNGYERLAVLSLQPTLFGIVSAHWSRLLSSRIETVTVIYHIRVFTTPSLGFSLFQCNDASI